MKKNPPLTDEQKGLVLSKYKAGMSMNKIARELKVGESQVYLFLQRSEVLIRPSRGVVPRSASIN
jgi:DNA invertase Pin-like site-specific DNA recombinase